MTAPAKCPSCGEPLNYSVCLRPLCKRYGHSPGEILATEQFEPRAADAAEPCSGCGARISGHLDGCPFAWPEYAKPKPAQQGEARIAELEGTIQTLVERTTTGAEIDRDEALARATAADRERDDFKLIADTRAAQMLTLAKACDQANETIARLEQCSRELSAGRLGALVACDTLKLERDRMRAGLECLHDGLEHFCEERDFKQREYLREIAREALNKRSNE